MPYADPLTRVVGVQWGGRWILQFSVQINMATADASLLAEGTSRLTAGNLTLSASVGVGTGPGNVIFTSNPNFNLNDFFKPSDLTAGPITVVASSRGSLGGSSQFIDTTVDTLIVPTVANGFLRRDLRVHASTMTTFARDFTFSGRVASTSGNAEADHYTINGKNLDPTTKPNPLAFTVSVGNPGPVGAGTSSNGVRTTTGDFVLDTINHKIVSQSVTDIDLS